MNIKRKGERTSVEKLLRENTQFTNRYSGNCPARPAQ